MNSAAAEDEEPISIKITVSAGGSSHDVESDTIPTVKDAWTALNTDDKDLAREAIPMVNNRVVPWLTCLVPGAVVHFVVP
jgi:hypothetical protein